MAFHDRIAGGQGEGTAGVTGPIEDTKPSPAVFMLVLAVLLLVFQFAFLTRDLEYLASHFLVDDTYYYLQTAWNLVRTGFVSFDGLHATNGVQLLWFWLVSFIGFLAPDKEACVRLVLGACFLLNTACLAPISAIARLSGRSGLVFFMGAFWFLIVVTNHVYWSGMENSLHALIFWIVIWRALGILTQPAEGGRPGLPSLAVILVLNAWTRLDAAVFSILIFLVCTASLCAASGGARPFLASHGRKAALAVALAASGALIHLALFRLMGGSILPVSALVKSANAGWSLSADRWSRMATFLRYGAPSVEADPQPISIALAVCLVVLFAVLLRIPRGGLVQSAILMGIMTALILLTLTTRRYEIAFPLGAAAAIYLARGASRDERGSALSGPWGGPPGSRPFVLLWWTLLAGVVIYSATFAFGGIDYDAYFTWYRSPLYAFWVLTGALLILAIDRLASSIVEEKPRSLAMAGAGVLVVALAAGGFSRGFVYHAMLAAQYRTGVALAGKLPEDTLLAAWNAGAVSWFSGRRVINLDGLINDPSYFREVLKGRRPLIDYLRENGVGYVVDYCCVDENGLRESLRPVTSFPTWEGWKPIVLWQVLPESTHS